MWIERVAYDALLKKYRKQQDVIKAAKALVKLSQDGYQTAEEWTALINALIKTLVKLDGE